MFNETVKYEVPLSLVAVLLLYLLVNDGQLRNKDENVLSRIDAGILLLLFVAFLYIYRTMKSTIDQEENEVVKIFPWKSIGLFALGLVMLVGGGKLVVDKAVEIADYFGLSKKLIGLTILAAGTSLPELATSAVAAIRKNTDIAIGNVVGSNIFNICLVLGVSGSISPIPFNTAINFDIMCLASLLF